MTTRKFFLPQASNIEKKGKTLEKLTDDEEEEEDESRKGEQALDTTAGADNSAAQGGDGGAGNEGGEGGPQGCNNSRNGGSEAFVPVPPRDDLRALPTS